jgi:uncharacterized membrane protein YsdA (DUF1294 family)
VAAAVKSNRCLQTLLLRRNTLGGGASLVFAHVLRRHNTTLQMLEVSVAQILVIEGCH